jgi:hypothetical protein
MNLHGQVFYFVLFTATHDDGYSIAKRALEN